MVRVRKRKKTKKRKRSSASIRRGLRKYFRRLRSIVGLAGIIIAVALGLFMYNGGCSEKAEDKNKTVSQSEYDGIDVSKYQGYIDWTKVAQDKNIQFVYIKASEGASKVDKRYHEYIKGARKAGLKVGSYHYFIGRKSARNQFDNFNRYIDQSKQDLIPMVDVEEAGNRTVSRSELQRNLKEFMQLIKDEYGKYPLLYSQYGFYLNKLSPEFDRHYLFLARYSNTPPSLDGCKYNIWQYTEKGKIEGIKGYVDLDRFCNGTTLSDIEL